MLEQIVIYSAVVCVSVCFAGAILGSAHAYILLERTNEDVYPQRRDSLDWRVTLVATTWFLLAMIFAVAVASVAVLGSQSLVGQAVLILVVFSGASVGLLTTEFFAVMYHPGVGLTYRISALAEKKLSEKPEVRWKEASVDKTFRRFLVTIREAVGKLALFRWIRLTDLFVSEKDRAKRQSRSYVSRLTFSRPQKRALGDILLLFAWGVSLWLVPLLLAGMFLEVVGADWLDFDADLLIAISTAVICVIQIAAIYYIHRSATLDHDISASYVPKQYARKYSKDLYVPNSQVKRESRTRGLEVIIRSRRHRARVLFVFNILFLFLLFLSGFQFEFIALALSVVSVTSIYSLIQYQRRIVWIWESVGIDHANLISHLFMKESAHQLKNLIEPVDYALVRAEEVLERSVSLYEHNLVRYRFLERRLSGGVEGVAEIREWLENIREESRSFSDRRQGWLSPERDKWVPLEKIVRSWLLRVEAALAGHYSGSDVPIKIVFRTGKFMKLITATSDSEAVAIEDLTKFEDFHGESRSSSAIERDDLGIINEDYVVKVADSVLIDILINLARNALQALQGQRNAVQRREIHLGLSIQEGDPYPVRFSIFDNGPGIPEELRQHVFQPAITTKTRGMGMGLFMAQEYLHTIGGRIFFTTSAERDISASFTSFVVEIPVTRFTPNGMSKA